MAYPKTYNPCDDCPYSFSKNNQESNMCKICEFKQLLDKPTADVVEVVRCKDCKQFMKYAEGVQCVEKSNGDCFIRMMCCIDRQFVGVTYDDFCSYGEQKEGAE